MVLPSRRSSMTMRRQVNDNAGHLVGWVIWESLAELVTVDDVVVPAEYRLRLPGADDQPSVDITFQVRNGAPFCAGIHLDAKSAGREVRACDMEAITGRFSQWSRAAFTGAAKQMEPLDPPLQNWAGLSLAPADEAEPAYDRAPKRRRRITDRLLAEVAELYRDNIDSESAWRAIRECYNVSPTTAGRYVMMARQAGHLPATTPGKKKA